MTCYSRNLKDFLITRKWGHIWKCGKDGLQEDVTWTISYCKGKGKWIHRHTVAVSKISDLPHGKNIKSMMLLWFCSPLQVSSSPRWAACTLPSVKHIVSLAVYEWNLSSGYILVIHKYFVNGPCDQALAFNWLTDYLHQQFPIANTHLKRVGSLCSVITWLPSFKKEKHSHREWSSTWPRNHWLRENTARNFCIWLTFGNYRDFFWATSKYQVCEFIHKKKKNCTNHCDLSWVCFAAEKVNNLS